MLLKLKALKFHGMAGAFDEVIDEGIKRSRTPFEVLGRFAEDSERHARSIRYQMTGAKFPEYRELANYDFAESPVNGQQVRMLYEGAYIDETRNIVLVGGPGTGKSISAWCWRFRRSRPIVGCASSASSTWSTGFPLDGRRLSRVTHVAIGVGLGVAWVAGVSGGAGASRVSSVGGDAGTG